MNPHSENIENLRKKKSLLEQEYSNRREKFFASRNTVKLIDYILIVDRYLVKVRSYNYRYYFLRDWEKNFEYSSLPVNLESLIYVEKLGSSPLEAILNKTRSNLEKNDPWNIGSLKEMISKKKKEYQDACNQRFLRSQSKIDILAMELKKLESQLKVAQAEESWLRNELNASREYLRSYVKLWEDLSKIHVKITSLEKQIEQQKPYETAHKLAYAKAAILDDKSRSMAAQRREMIKKTDHCPYCGSELGNDAHLDHIQPINRGGLSIDENLVWCCAKCNLSKSNKGLIEFLLASNYNIEQTCTRLISLGKRV